MSNGLAKKKKKTSRRYVMKIGIVQNAFMLTKNNK